MFIIKILYGNRNFCSSLCCYTVYVLFQSPTFRCSCLSFLIILERNLPRNNLKYWRNVLSNLAVRTRPLCCQTWRWGRGLCAVIAFFIALKYNAPSLISRLTSSLRNPMPPAVSLMLWKHTAATRLPAFCKEGQREALLLDLISKTPRRSLRNKMEPKNDWLQDPLLVDTSKEKNSR